MSSAIPMSFFVSSIAIVGCEAEPAPETMIESNAQQSLTTAQNVECMRNENAELFAPGASEAALSQVKDLLRKWNVVDALKVLSLANTPQAVWFSSGTPKEVEKSVRHTMLEAKRQRQIPVLVAYNLPFRDCAQYSGGGAVDNVAYKAWIDGFVRGVGGGKAIVVLEPDGLGIIPNNTTIDGRVEWCKPTVQDPTGATAPAPGATPADRYELVNYAVDRLAAHAPKAQIYLDGSHSAWLGVGEAAYRLTKAGVLRATGFFLNVSNYQLTENNTQFGTWVSMALAAPSGAPAWAFDSAGNFHFDWLPSQYDPAQNYAVNYSPEYAATVTAGIASFMGTATARVPFVVDTSRNGQGPLQAERYSAAPYNQPTTVIDGLRGGSWCNPFGAGAGLRPTLSTGKALVNAYLWIKLPGESDGSCDIAGGARAWDYGLYNPWNVSADAQNHFDPLWGMVDPAAGVWFPAQALQLARKANPPLF